MGVMPGWTSNTLINICMWHATEIVHTHAVQALSRPTTGAEEKLNTCWICKHIGEEDVTATVRTVMDLFILIARRGRLARDWPCFASY